MKEKTANIINWILFLVVASLIGYTSFLAGWSVMDAVMYQTRLNTTDQPVTPQTLALPDR